MLGHAKGWIVLNPNLAAQKGMSLIEVLIGIAILGIVLMQGIPSFSEWLQNAQIRTVAESLTSGLQQARSEAVRRNAHVIFEPTSGGAQGATGWEIRLRNSDAVLQAQPDGTGSHNATVITNGTQITFNGMGRVLEKNPDGSPPITVIDIDNPNIAADKSRNLRITISSGGEIRMCDPNVPDPTDPRSC